MKALVSYPEPEIHHSDHGSQYSALAYTCLFPVTTHISMIEEAVLQKTGLLNVYFKTLKEEHIDYNEHVGFTDAVKQIVNWIEVDYMTERIQSTLDNLKLLKYELIHISV